MPALNTFWLHGIYNAFEHCQFICNADITNTLKFFKNSFKFQISRYVGRKLHETDLPF